MVSVYVSGATGFIAQHIVSQLVAKKYNVIGSVRSAEKGEQLKKDLGSDLFQYEIVEDIVTPGAFDESLKKHPEVTVFLHTASPFHFNTNDVEKDLLKPAIEGTKNALKSIKEYGPQITKVVVTSSYAAIAPPDGSPESPRELVLTEESWNPADLEKALKFPTLGYRASKTFAEKAAWEFLETEKPNFTLNCVNPAFVFGPQAFKSGVRSTLNTSSETLNAVVKAGTDESKVPKSFGGFVDVRDVARAHLHGFESDVTNFRYLLVTSRFATQDIVDIINKRIPSLKGKVSVGTPGSGKEITDKLAQVDNTKTRELLGEFISLEDSVVDSITQIVE